MFLSLKGTWAFMSGVSLRYPFKPNDLADDLESFVHIVCYNALRFHRHNMSRPEVNLRLQEAALKDANLKNETLAKWISLMYYDSTTDVGDIPVGGRDKLMRIQAGDAGFKMQNDNSPLAVLINDLYQLLRLHYAATNFADLERYAVARPILPEPATTRKYAPSARKLKTLKLKSTADSPAPVPAAAGVPDTAPVPATVPVLATAPVLATVPAPSSATPDPTHRPLDTHDEIMKLFSKAMDAMDLRIAQLGGNIDEDKVQDQLLGMYELVLQAPKLASGSKRKSGESGQDLRHDSERPAKVVNSGAGARLASVHEDKE